MTLNALIPQVFEIECNLNPNSNLIVDQNFAPDKSIFKPVGGHH